MPIDEIVFAVSCSATVTDEFELQLTKTGDKARNWMTMFQNWSTKDEIEDQSVQDEIEDTFSKIELRDDENGRETYMYMFWCPCKGFCPFSLSCFLSFFLFSSSLSFFFLFFFLSFFLSFYISFFLFFFLSFFLSLQVSFFIFSFFFFLLVIRKKTILRRSK